MPHLARGTRKAHEPVTKKGSKCEASILGNVMGHRQVIQMCEAHREPTLLKFPIFDKSSKLVPRAEHSQSKLSGHELESGWGRMGIRALCFALVAQNTTLLSNEASTDD